MKKKYKVKIYVYDLSCGTFKNLSRSILHKKIDAIWHSSIVVYDEEYFYGGKIFHDKPKKTEFGIPNIEIDIGETEISKEDFENYLRDISIDTFTEDKYHMIDNNCNHFTNNACLFLVGKEIPKYLTEQHLEFSNTLLGQIIFKVYNYFVNGK